MRAVPLYDPRIAAGPVVDVFRGWSHQSCTKSMLIAAQAPYPALSDSYLCALSRSVADCDMRHVYEGRRGLGFSRFFFSFV